MKKDEKHIEPNLTVKVNYPSDKLLSFARALQDRKEEKKKKLTVSN